MKQAIAYQQEGVKRHAATGYADKVPVKHGALPVGAVTLCRNGAYKLTGLQVSVPPAWAAAAIYAATQGEKVGATPIWELAVDPLANYRGEVVKKDYNKPINNEETRKSKDT